MIWPYRRRLACVLIAFYALATLRGLVPGLCATLTASSDAAEHHRAAVSCCTPEMCASPENAQGEHLYAQGAAHAPCALCHLVSALTVPTALAPPSRPLEELAGPLSSVLIEPDFSAMAAWHRGRAPPAGNTVSR